MKILNITKRLNGVQGHVKKTQTGDEACGWKTVVWLNLKTIKLILNSIINSFRFTFKNSIDSICKNHQI